MNIRQAMKMAWKSIWGKKGRSALTMLGIIIGIAAVMTIVSAINGYTTKTMEQYAAMGSNKLTVYIWNYMYDENGNSLGKDYFPDLYDYCNTLKEYVVGVTPQANCNATVVYGTKSSANMQYNYDDKGNPIGDFPPNIYYGSDQYGLCNNLTVSKGRDISMLDCQRYNQVCVLGATAAKTFFDGVDPVGKEMQFNGQNFLVVGVYKARVEEDSPTSRNLDNFILVPYTARRVLGGAAPEQFIVKARSADTMVEASSRIGGFLKGLVDADGHDLHDPGRHRRHQPAGGRHRHHEHHAGHRHGAHQGDRHPPGHRRRAGLHRHPVPDRSGHALRHRRHLRYSGGHRRQPCGRQADVQDDHLPGGMDHAVRLYAVGGPGHPVRHLPGGQGVQTPACGSPAGGMRGKVL